MKHDITGTSPKNPPESYPSFHHPQFCRPSNLKNMMLQLWQLLMQQDPTVNLCVCGKPDNKTLPLYPVTIGKASNSIPTHGEPYRTVNHWGIILQELNKGHSQLTLVLDVLWSWGYHMNAKPGLISPDTFLIEWYCPIKHDIVTPAKPSPNSPEIGFL